MPAAFGGVIDSVTVRNVPGIQSARHGGVTVITPGPPSATFAITGNLGTLVGGDFRTPTSHNVVVRLDLAGGGRDPSLPVTTVAADGTFTLADVPSTTISGVRYRLTAAWRTAVPGVPVQEIVLDNLAITADSTLLGLLS